jgi:hypothetical protein
LRNIPFRFWNVTWVWDLKYFVKWSSCFKYGIKLWFYWFPKYFYWFNSKIFFILILYSWFWEWYYFVKFLNIWCWLMWESYTIFKLYSHISSVKYYFRESLFKIVTVILLNILSRTLQLGRYFRFNFC